MVRARLWRVTAIVGGLMAIAAWGASGALAEYTPLNHRGPRLSVPSKQLRAALKCTASVASDSREPILLVPGTTMTPEVNFSWNYERALNALGLPYCTIELPNRAMSDIQVAGEYVVYALRKMSKFEGRRSRKVQVIGYSQGGMVPRWALRFWPDTRKLVDDDIGLDASNHGTITAESSCQNEGCAPAVWQQRNNSAFFAALNSYAETFATDDAKYNQEIAETFADPSYHVASEPPLKCYVTASC